MEREKSCILAVDDDETVLSALYHVVQACDMNVRVAKSGEEALDVLKNERFDLILMDINMSGMDGFRTVAEIRLRDIHTPIILVSGRKEDCDTVHGLDIGADDYVTKPFNPVTLGAKIKALIRRSKAAENPENNVIKAGPFEYDLTTFRCRKNGKEIPLTSKENTMMKLFLDNVNRVFTKDVLYETVWGGEELDDNTIMVYIKRLRTKIEDDPSSPQYIQTVWGLGYRFVV